MITHQQVDELGAAISPAIDAEGAAQAELDRVKSAYSQQVCDALSEPLDRYHFVVAARLEELSDLLSVGAAFRQQARNCGAVLDRRTLELTPHLLTLVNEAKKVLSVGAPKSKAAAA
ncbi:hypothetical protein ATO13_17269 [Stappia sp. 22II-S9-Z10]|nr:hypothetical protein ATO13_17269 [Stappia sp. 22II-S9-Z10]